MNPTAGREAARVLQFAGFTLDLERRGLYRDGERIHLTSKPLETLIFLLQNGGRTVTKQELMDAVWKDTAVTDGTLVQAIREIRKALHDDMDDPRFVQTVPRQGYRFVGRVTVVPDSDASSSARTERAAVPIDRALAAPRRGVLRLPKAATGWTLAVLVAAAVAIVAVGYGLRRSVVVSEAGGTIDALVVLRFENVGANPESEYLSDGFTESLINRLSRLRGLRVISRTSAFRYKAGAVDLSTVGRDLNVKAVLVGRVRQRAEELSISAELVDARDGRQLWGEQYQRRLTDVVVLEEEVARDVARALHLRWSDTAPVAERRPPNTTAYHAYLRGRFHWNKRTPDGFKNAIDQFRAAIKADPEYALPYAGLGDTYILMGYSRSLPASEGHAQARAAALKALEIDETIAEAHVTIARLKAIEWDWSGAERAFRRAIELNPNYAPARHWYSNHLTNMGRHDEAIAEAKRAVELDPLSVVVNGGALGAAYLFAGRYEQAIDQYRKTLELDSRFANAHALLGMTYIRQRKYQEATTELRQAIALNNSAGWRAHLGYVYAAMGRRDEARALLNELQPGEVSLVIIAAVHAAMGDPDRAFALLEEAYAAREPELSEIRTHLVFDCLRDDPRFQGLLRRMNLL